MDQRDTTIVVSDVHISNHEGYSWFSSEDARNFTGMLKDIAGSSKVAELVLLGDLFDLWLYPVEVRPLTVKQIMDIPENQPITEALKQCVANVPAVYYMNGNHDMAVTPGDLELFSCDTNKIHVIDPKQYNANNANQRRLQHGHEVDMFNAPVPDEFKGDTIGGYPLGYFITRLAAEADALVWGELKTLLHGMHEDLHQAEIPDKSDVKEMSADLPRNVINKLLSHAPKIGPGKGIVFQPDLDRTYTIRDVMEKYGGLYSRWHKKYGKRTLDTMLASRHFVGIGPFGLGGLGWYAETLLTQSPDNPTPPKIVVMGHTHQAIGEGGYTNDGCCCGSSSLNYVEIIGDQVNPRSWPS